MSLYLDDILGLNPVTLAAMPIAHDARHAQKLAQECQHPLSITGSRHSQGGHTVFPEGTAMLTEPMNRVLKVDRMQQTIKVEAGATWNVLHAHLAPHGLAPLVQQSSPHFTVGGSISVNCHGRDARQGPLSNCIVSMEVYVPSSPLPQPQTVLPGTPLFNAIVGGYGSAAVILTVTLKVTYNHQLRQCARQLTLRQYAHEIQDWQGKSTWPELHLHYAWLNFSDVELFQTVLAVDCSRTRDNQPAIQNQLNEDGWLEIELMRWLWEEHSEAEPSSLLQRLLDFFKGSRPERYSLLTRDLVWNSVVNYFESQNHENNGNGRTLSRIDWLRQSIAFTSHRSETHVDLLQEYFVPLEKFEPFIQALGHLIKQYNVNLLSSTVRVVQPESPYCSHLSYAPDQAMACIALDFESPLVSGPSGKNKTPAPRTTQWAREAINLSMQHGGRYYLPYYGFATLQQFQTAYQNWHQQKTAKANPLTSLFIDTYLK